MESIIPQQDDADMAGDERVMLGLLESVERDGSRSQRQLAADFGVALGLVNAYLKRCINKGLVKVKEAPARRYTYYLTPQGFAEKSRLTVEYLTYSFSFFRRARADCAETLGTAKRRGWTRVALIGVSDLAEIAIICGLESGIAIAAIVDPETSQGRFVGAPVFADLGDVAVVDFDGVIITDLKNAQASFETAVARVGRERVLVPALLSISTKSKSVVEL
jgi:DNA-binding MarR family transcriptional regulator